jgi:hypothetical protein
MPIFIDASERAKSSNMPMIKNEIVVAGMEKETGADIIVSRLTAVPTTIQIVHLHARFGAAFVQRKSGSDLADSVGARMNSSIAKMLTLPVAYAGQRMLVTTGHFETNEKWNTVVGQTLNRKGKVPFIKWYPNERTNYKALHTSIRRWAMHGGVSVIPLGKDADLTWWLQGLEEDIINFHDNPVRYIYEPMDFPDDAPLPTDPIQLPRRVTDARRAIAMFPGIGYKKANDVWIASNEDFFLSVAILTDEENEHKAIRPRGVGPKTIANCRAWLALKPGMEAIVRYREAFEMVVQAGAQKEK